MKQTTRFSLVSHVPGFYLSGPRLLMANFGLLSPLS